MRRAPSSRNRQGDGLRNSVFDAARSIGLADPNALRWLEQNANISEEDEEEEEAKREPRPPSDAHPPSLVFSTSSSEPDSSVNSPSNDHSTNFRAPYRPAAKAQYQAYGQQAYGQPQYFAQTSQPTSQLQVDTRLPADSSTRNSPNPLNRPPPPSLGLKIPDPWPPSHLAIASLSPSPSTSRAPTPADPTNAKQPGEPRKARKLTKPPRADAESEIVSARKVSAGAESASSSGTGGIPPMLPVLPFPSAISGEALGSDASVSGLSAISGSSSGTVTQPRIVLPEQENQSILFPSTPIANEPRSVFEDDNDDKGPTFSTIPFSSTSVTSSNHTHNSPSTSTAASAETPAAGPSGKDAKEGKGGILRTMRSFKLSLKGQKAPKVPLPEAPPVPTVPSLPPVLTLKLGKDAGAEFAKQLQGEGGAGDKSSGAKEREDRTFQIAEMFKPSERVEPAKPSVPTTQSQPSEPIQRIGSDQGVAGSHSDLDHAPIRVAGGGGFWSADVGSKKSWTTKTSKAPQGRRMSVDEAGGAAEPTKETAKATERIRAGTVGTRSGHARTRSKSGDFSGVGWEKSARPPVPKVAKGPKTKVMRVANPDPISPKISFDSDTRHSLERDGFGARGEHDEMRALDVQHQLQSFVASMRTVGGEDTEEVQGGFSRASEESFDRRVIPRTKGDDSDTLRSSGEYDPFRAFGPPARSITAPLPRPESEAIPHQLIIPAHSIPRELGQTSASPVVHTPRQAPPPSAFKSPLGGSPATQVQVSSSNRPSIVVGGVPGEQSKPAADAAEEAQSEAQSRPTSQESEHGVGYSGFGFARSAADVPAAVDNDASEEWVVPSPSWPPLEPKRGRSPAPDAALEPPQSKFLDVRPERQRASGLSIPRSVTPDSPRTMPTLPQTRIVIPLAGSRSPIPLATPSPGATSAASRSTSPLGANRTAFVPLVARSLTPQPRAESPSLVRETTPPGRPGVLSSRQPAQAEGRNSSSSPVSRRTLPVRTSSISSISSSEQSHGQGSRVRSPPPRIIVPASVPGPRSAQPAFAARSMTSTPISRSATSTPVPRSMSTTPTPRANEEEQPLRHEAFSRFLAPETIPATQKRGRVSPFPTRPVRDRSESQDRISAATAVPKSSWEAPEESQPNQREKFPGGVDKYGSDGLMQAPRVRFIGVRSSNGSSQADWQGRMEDMRKEGPPARTGSWIEYQEDSARPVSWESGLAYDEDPVNLPYDETTQESDEAMRYPAYTEETQENTRDSTSSEARSNIGAVQPPEPRYPGWAVDAPASRASTFTVASVYDDEEPIPSVPNTQKLAATIRGMGMGQSTWARGRI